MLQLFDELRKNALATLVLLAGTITAQASPSTSSELAFTTPTETRTWTGDADDPYFIGYWINSDEGTPAPYETVRITAHTPWVTSGTYAGDCDEADEPCYLATECTTSGSVVKLLSANSLSSECFEGKCHTMTIYATSPEGRPTAHNIACREKDWSIDSLYQVSPTPATSSEEPERTDGDVAHDRNFARSSSSSVMVYWVSGMVLGIAGILACGYCAFLRRRTRRKLADMQSQMEISTFAATRGYGPGNANVLQTVATETESTVAETRLATMGETVPSTVDFRPERAATSEPSTAAESENMTAFQTGSKVATK